jgi:hypothetical protein
VVRRRTRIRGKGRFEDFLQMPTLLPVSAVTRGGSEPAISGQ